MYTLLMGMFNIPAPLNYLGSTSVGKNISLVVHKTGPWVLPLQEEPQVPLSTIEVAYQAIYNVGDASIVTPPPFLEESDEAYLPA